MARTATEIQAEITEIDTALSHIRAGGQGYTINSASGGGTARTVTMADYNTLVKHRDDLYQELSSVNSTRAFRFTPGW